MCSLVENTGLGVRLRTLGGSPLEYHWFIERGEAGPVLSSKWVPSTDLSFIADDSCGAVLMLGPFYNLSLPEERRIRSRGSFGTSTTSYGSSLPNYGTTHRANGDRGRQRRGKIRSSHRMRPPLAKPPRV